MFSAAPAITPESFMYLLLENLVSPVSSSSLRVTSFPFSAEFAAKKSDLIVMPSSMSKPSLHCSSPNFFFATFSLLVPMPLLSIKATVMNWLRRSFLPFLTSPNTISRSLRSSSLFLFAALSGSVFSRSSANRYSSLRPFTCSTLKEPSVMPKMAIPSRV